MIKSIKHIGIVLILISSMVFESCKKDNYSYYDQLAQDMSGVNNSFLGIAKSTRLNTTSLGDTTTNPPKLPAFLTNNASGEVTVQGEIDTSLIKDYNTMFSENNRSYAQGAFRLLNDGVVKISSGSSQSQDSITVLLNKSGLLLHNSVYVIPVRLKIIAGSGTLKTKVYFFKIKVTINDIYGRWNVTSRNLNTYSTTLNGSIYANYKYEIINDAKVSDIGQIMIQGGVKLANKYIPVKIYGKENRTDSLLRYFNTTFKASASLFPTNSYTILKNYANVAVNGLTSVDSFRLQITDYTKFQFDSTYVLPIEVYTPTGDTSAVNPDTTLQKYAFIGFTIPHLQSANVDSTNKIVTGTMLNKSAWLVNASDGTNYTSNPPKNVIDGSASTYWASLTATPLYLGMNIGTTKTIKGFRFTPQYATIARDFIRMLVYSSSDSSNWHQEGYYFGTATKTTTSATNPDYKYVGFNTPVTAKYFRFYILKSSYTYLQTSIAEIDAFE